MEEIFEDKRVFVFAWSEFLLKYDALRTVNLHHLSYVKDGDQEWVYIFVGIGGSQKRVNVTADSKEAMMRDTLKALSDWQNIDYAIGEDRYEVVAKRAYADDGSGYAD